MEYRQVTAGGTIMDYSLQQIAQMVDHTNLHADATTADFQKLCDEAIQYGFKSVAINTYPVAMCRKMLEGSQVLTGAAVGFPLGQTTIATKTAEAENAVKDGAQEFDYVLNVGKLKEHDYAYIEEEMRALVAVARKAGICAKVIFETCYLTEEEIIEAAKIASRVKPDFVKYRIWNRRSKAGTCTSDEAVCGSRCSGQGSRRNPYLGSSERNGRSRSNTSRNFQRNQDH